MTYYKVMMFESGRGLIEVRVKAPSAAAARRKADELRPDAVHMSTDRILRSGARV